MLLKKPERSLRYDPQLDAWVSDGDSGITNYRKADEDNIRVLGDAFSVGFILGGASTGVLFSFLMLLGFLI